MWNEVQNLPILDDVDASVPWTSTVVELYGPYSLQISFSGSPVGELLLESSNDGETFVPNGDQDISGARSWQYTDPAPIFKFLRLTWTPTSGDGSLTVVCRTFSN